MIDKDNVHDDIEEMWRGGWRTRHLQRMQAMGAATVSEFLARFPAVPLYKLLRELQFLAAPAQIKTLQFDEARRCGVIREASKDLLVRTLNEFTKRGWKCGGRWEQNHASAYSHFINDLAVHSRESALREIGEGVWKALDKSQPPAGWIPTDTNDHLIQEAFRVAWPVDTPRMGSASR